MNQKRSNVHNAEIVKDQNNLRPTKIKEGIDVMTKIYMVVLYDISGDSYNDRAFEREADAIKYAYTQIKDDEFLRENFADSEIENESYEEWIKRKIKKGIDETVYIEEIDVY